MQNQQEQLEEILNSFKDGSAGLKEALEAVQDLYYKDIGHTKIDTHRAERTGYPEVIFCRGKSSEQIGDIVSAMAEKQVDVLATLLSPDAYEELRAPLQSALASPRDGHTDGGPAVEYHRDAQILTIRFSPWEERGKGEIAVVSAGTSDFRVAEEAALTASFYGHRVIRYNDVGVAGIHRLLSKIDEIRRARVVVTVAGMEGALAGVIGGLVSVPVIAVPTSVGYGANFHGLSALLTMLNSCSSGISVVNIDNGFGAGYLAGMINAL
ncbi:MAG: nickel pincer cofactor biosynthesis protein LarB [Spirochaetia bacterium]